MQVKKNVKSFQYPKDTLFLLHIIEAVLIFLFSVFVYTLPRSVSFLNNLSDNWDLFYKFLFRFFLNNLEERYIITGNALTILAFMHLISALIAHGKFYKLIFINIFASFFLVFFFPIGIILFGWNLFLIFVFWKNRNIT
jgi:hypothetical protein